VLEPGWIVNPLMYHLQLTLETPAANLALDEALLEAAETGQWKGEVLRIWEPATYFVVLGRSSDAEAEVRVKACLADNVPVLRRPSGGAAVLAGPGCLMFALVLDLNDRPELRAVDTAHGFVLGRVAAALAPLAPGAVRAGTSDLALAPASGAPRKFAGNSLRLKRTHLLYHGTILYDFAVERIGRWLGPPAKEPEYRQRRSHDKFLANFPARRAALAAALVREWDADETLADWPHERVAELTAKKYATIDW